MIILKLMLSAHCWYSVLFVTVVVCRKTVCVAEALRLKKVSQRGLQLLKQNYSMVGSLCVF